MRLYQWWAWGCAVETAPAGRESAATAVCTMATRCTMSADEKMATIRKYGSTFYVGIAMVVLPYIGTVGKLKFQFPLSVSTQFDFYQHRSVKS